MPSFAVERGQKYQAPGVINNFDWPLNDKDYIAPYQNTIVRSHESKVSPPKYITLRSVDRINQSSTDRSLCQFNIKLPIDTGVSYLLYYISFSMNNTDSGAFSTTVNQIQFNEYIKTHSYGTERDGPTNIAGYVTGYAGVNTSKIPHSVVRMEDLNTRGITVELRNIATPKNTARTAVGNDWAIELMLLPE